MIGLRDTYRYLRSLISTTNSTGESSLLLKYYAAGFTSMLRSSARLEGRSWLTEMINRTLKAIFDAPENEDIGRLRKIIDAAAGYHPAMGKVQFEHVNIEGVSCLRVTPKQETSITIVYFHGGGYVFGSPDGYRGLLAQLAVNSRATVIAPDYRLAPEHPYPAPQQDCLAVATQVFSEYKTHTKFVAGDSAGGALAIMCALKLAEARENEPDACVLLSPWINPLEQGGTMQSNIQHDFLLQSFLDFSYESLMQDRPPSEDVQLINVDLSSLPSTLVQSGSGEVFHDQINAFCGRASDAGVSIEHQSYAAQFHVFQLLSPLLKQARLAVKEISIFVNTIQSK